LPPIGTPPLGGRLVLVVETAVVVVPDVVVVVVGDGALVMVAV
jgi:hypothetical protein